MECENCKKAGEPNDILKAAIDYIDKTYPDRGEYVVMGSSALAGHLTKDQYWERNCRQGRKGSLPIVRDVDIIILNTGVRQEEQLMLCEKHNIKVEIDMWDPDVVKGDDEWWDEYNIATIKNSITKTLTTSENEEFTVKIANMEQIIMLKMKLYRLKDQYDITYIEELKKCN